MSREVLPNRKKRITFFLAVALLVLLTSFVLERRRVAVPTHGTWLSGRKHYNALQVTTAEIADIRQPVPRDILILSQQKRVLGRAESFDELFRTEEDVLPLIRRALQQPSVQADVKTFAAELKMRNAEFMNYWERLQEADLYLESGGNPDAISPAGACGVAQWMPGPGKKMGLRIDIDKSLAFTLQISMLNQEAARLISLIKQAPTSTTPQQNQDASHLLETILSRIKSLQKQRAKVDDRFNPQIAIFAQTRYLLALWHKLPDASWLFQAYHGGEAGAERTIKRWMGKKYTGTAAAAIRGGYGGNPLDFETVYLTSTPTLHPRAFEYLYSRGDDHRHYWWKILCAATAFEALHNHPTGIRVMYGLLLPGAPPPAIWYGTDPRGFRNLKDIQESLAAGELVPIRAEESMQISIPPVNTAEQASPMLSSLTPEAAACLKAVARQYRLAGGKERLLVCQMCQTEQQQAVYGPLTLDFHRIGVAFDLRVPQDKHSKRILDYTLGVLEDRMLIFRHLDKARGCWAVSPNPAFTGLTAASMHP